MNRNKLDGLHDVDPDELDAMVQSGNMSARQTKLDIFENATRRAGNLFSFVNEAKIKSIAELALQRKYGTRAYCLAMEKITMELDSFPSFKDVRRMVELCSHTDGPSPEEKRSFFLKNKEREEYLELRETFINLMGEEVLDKYVGWWVKNTFPVLNDGIMNSFSISPGIFERCALFDWKDSGMSKDFELIKLMSLKKISMLSDKHPYDESRIILNRVDIMKDLSNDNQTVE